MVSGHGCEWEENKKKPAVNLDSLAVIPPRPGLFGELFKGSPRD